MIDRTNLTDPLLFEFKIEGNLDIHQTLSVVFELNGNLHSQPAGE
jgi:hypothetical protein